MVMLSGFKNQGRGAMRVGVDVSMGHPPFPPTVPATGSFVTSVTFIPAVRVADIYVPHCAAGCHIPVAVMGSVYTMIDMRPCHMGLEMLSCGDQSLLGSLTGYSS